MKTLIKMLRWCKVKSIFSRELEDRGRLSAREQSLSKALWLSPQETSPSKARSFRGCSEHTVSQVKKPNTGPGHLVLPKAFVIAALLHLQPCLGLWSTGQPRHFFSSGFQVHRHPEYGSGQHARSLCGRLWPQGTRKHWIATYSCRLHELPFFMRYIFFKQLFCYLENWTKCQIKPDFTFDAISMKLHEASRARISWRNRERCKPSQAGRLLGWSSEHPQGP